MITKTIVWTAMVLNCLAAFVSGYNGNYLQGIFHLLFAIVMLGVLKV